MSTQWIVPAVITIVAAGVSMGLTQRLWPNPQGALTPPANLLPLFIVLQALGCVLFGLGVSFVIFGYGLMLRGRQPVWMTFATYLSIAWLLLSWWPHGNLHRVTVPGDWMGLLAIDYGFHLTLMVAAVTVAIFFVRAMNSNHSYPGTGRTI